MLGNPLVQLVLGILIGAWLGLTGLHSDFWGWACLLVAVALVAIAGLVALIRWLQWPQSFRFSLSSLALLRWNGRLPLPKAAQILYSEARATDSIWAHAAERLAIDKSPEGILNYIAQVIIIDHPVYGKRVPSTHVECLEPSQSKHGTITGGAGEIHMRDNTRAVFKDLEVDASSLRAALQQVRVNLKTTTPI